MGLYFLGKIGLCLFTVVYRALVVLLRATAMPVHSVFVLILICAKPMTRAQRFSLRSQHLDMSCRTMCSILTVSSCFYYFLFFGHGVNGHLPAQGDTVGARNKQSEFMSEDYNFEDSREWR